MKEGAKPSQSQPTPPGKANKLLRSRSRSQSQSPSKSGEATNLPRPQLSEAKNPASTQEKPNKKRKLAPFERSWSRADELRILEALAEHAKSNGGAPEPSDLFAALAGSLENKDARLDKLTDKVRKLKKRYDKTRLQGCPSDDDELRLFKLCENVWGVASQNNRGDASITLRRSTRKSNGGQVVPLDVREGGGGRGDGDAGTLERGSQPVKGADVDVGARKDKKLLFEEDGDVNFGTHKGERGRVEEDGQVKAAYVRREFSELASLYPYLAEEVKGYANTHSCGDLIKTAFEIIGDDEARYLDARCKKQIIDKLNLEMNQVDLTKVLLCTFRGLIN